MVAGDVVGNAVMLAHIVLAFVITVGGPLQLVPRIRARAPRFHRWNGSIYLATATVMSLGGLYLTWARFEDLPSILNGVAISLNAVLILIFGAMTLRRAMARNIAAHQRWALRLFVAVSGVWFPATPTVSCSRLDANVAERPHRRPLSNKHLSHSQGWPLDRDHS